MATRKRRDEKTAIVQEYLQGGKSLRDLALKHNVAFSTVRDWVVEAGHNIAQFRSDALEQSADVLSKQLLTSALAMNEQATLLGDRQFLLSAEPERIKEISGAHKSLAESGFRFMEAIQRARAEQEVRRLAIEEGDIEEENSGGR